MSNKKQLKWHEVAQRFNEKQMKELIEELKNYDSIQKNKRITEILLGVVGLRNSPASVFGLSLSLQDGPPKPSKDFLPLTLFGLPAKVQEVYKGMAREFMNGEMIDMRLAYYPILGDAIGKFIGHSNAKRTFTIPGSVEISPDGKSIKGTSIKENDNKLLSTIPDNWEEIPLNFDLPPNTLPYYDPSTLKSVADKSEFDPEKEYLFENEQSSMKSNEGVQENVDISINDNLTLVNQSQENQENEDTTQESKQSKQTNDEHDARLEHSDYVNNETKLEDGNAPKKDAIPPDNSPSDSGVHDTSPMTGVGDIQNHPVEPAENNTKSDADNNKDTASIQNESYNAPPKDAGPPDSSPSDAGVQDTLPTMGVGDIHYHIAEPGSTSKHKSTTAPRGCSISPSSLQPGDIIATSAKTFVSNAIQQYTESFYSHSMMYIGDGKVVEAIKRDGVVERPLEKALEGVSHATVFRHKDMNPLSAKIAVDEIMKYSELGVKYDTLGAIVADSYFLCGKIDSDENFFCSELVADILLKAGTPIIDKEPSCIIPGDLRWAELRGDVIYKGDLVTSEIQEKQSTTNREREISDSVSKSLEHKKTSQNMQDFQQTDAEGKIDNNQPSEIENNLGKEFRIPEFIPNSETKTGKGKLPQADLKSIQKLHESPQINETLSNETLENKKEIAKQHENIGINPKLLEKLKNAANEHKEPASKKENQSAQK